MINSKENTIKLLEELIIGVKDDSVDVLRISTKVDFIELRDENYQLEIVPSGIKYFSVMFTNKGKSDE